MSEDIKKNEEDLEREKREQEERDQAELTRLMEGPVTLEFIEKGMAYLEKHRDLVEIYEARQKARRDRINFESTCEQIRKEGCIYMSAHIEWKTGLLVSLP